MGDISIQKDKHVFDNPKVLLLWHIIKSGILTFRVRFEDHFLKDVVIKLAFDQLVVKFNKREKCILMNLPSIQMA